MGASKKVVGISFPRNNPNLGLEPSILSVLPPGENVEYVDDNRSFVDHDIGMYLCSVYINGVNEFKEWAMKHDTRKIVVGGYHPTMFPEDFLNFVNKIVVGPCDDLDATLSQKGVLFEKSHYDGLQIGNARFVEDRILKRFSSVEGWTRIHGEMSSNQEFPEEPSGKADVLEDRVLPGVLTFRNSPRYDLYDIRKNQQIIPDKKIDDLSTSINTSMGCPYKCDFCCINAPFGKSVFRYWNPEFMITEFDKIANMGIRNIKIADEMFVLNKNHFLKICDLIIERGYDFNIGAYARIDTVREEYLEKLKKAGVNWLALGIESGNRKVRIDAAKGKFDEVDVTDIVKKIESFDIEVISNYMFGMSGDTHETMQETLDLAIELNTSGANFNPTMIFPGSPLFTDAVNKGIELPPTYSGYSYYSKDSFPNPADNLTREEILKFRDDAFQKYFNRKEWFGKIRKKFGQETVDIYKDILKIKLERKL